MSRSSTLWKANVIAFSSSFCVMVIELIAARILAPHIGVSLYTWTSIIGVILSGIALGNYLGGKIADRYTSPLVLVVLFFVGSLATIAILPTTKAAASADWFDRLPLMLNFVLRVSFIFLLPAIILSMVSPVVIKLTLADLGQTGGVVGTIYAVSTVGAIVGTFLTGFYFILWFGTRMIVWLVAAALLLTGILAWFSWKVPGRWHLSRRNLVVWTITIVVLITYVFLFQFRGSWQENYTKESNYYAIRVYDAVGNFKVLSLDHLVHSYVALDDPTTLKYDYLKIFAEMARYLSRQNANWAPRVLHLGGGGYSFPRYLEAVYPGSANEVVEIDPAVTQVAYEELGLPRGTGIRTYNQDARLFLIQRKTGDKYNLIVGDVFNDYSTPYHLTTLEFDRLLKTNMEPDGIYLVNIIDNYRQGRYMPSIIHTLQQTFNWVYLFGALESWEYYGTSTFVLAATDRRLDLADYKQFATEGGQKKAAGNPHEETRLVQYLAERDAVLLTDDYAPTDILVARILR